MPQGARNLARSVVQSGYVDTKRNPMSIPMMENYPAIIGSEKLRTSATFDTVDPSTGQVFAAVPRCGQTEVDQAVEAARQTHETAWCKATPSERARVLHEIARLIQRDHEELSRLESTDTGKPLKQARADVTVGARYFEFYANTIESFYEDTIPALADTLVSLTE